MLTAPFALTRPCPDEKIKLSNFLSEEIVGMLKFLADDMVGKLARRLRLAGYDTLYFKHIDDGQMVTRARTEERIIVTRDRKLADKFHLENVYIVGSEVPAEQFRQVVKAFDLDVKSEAFSRCLECNELLVPAKKEDHKAEIPPRVYRLHNTFFRCPGCKKLYWRGSHYARLKEMLSASEGES